MSAVLKPELMLTAEPGDAIERVALDGGYGYIVHKPGSKPVFNRTNDMVGWASYTWNPVSGCWHACPYCYARAIANNGRMAEAYPRQFEPTFHEARLRAPDNMPVPKKIKRPEDKNVFVCSMSDLFGKWVPDEWIMRVFEPVIRHREWNFLFLTKFPQRLRAVCDQLGGFPANAWVGCTVAVPKGLEKRVRRMLAKYPEMRWDDFVQGC
jgi:protein gp37